MLQPNDPDSLGHNGHYLNVPPATYFEAPLRELSGELRRENILPDLVLPQYRKETLELLALYFEGVADKTQLAMLAGQLIFPNDSVGAALMSNHNIRNSRGGTQTAAGELHAHAVFPNCQAARDSWERLHYGVSPNPLHDLVMVYATRSYGDSPDLLAANLKRMQTKFEYLSGTEATSAERQEDLVRFVRGELLSETRAALPDETLAVMYGLPIKAVREALHHPHKGLTDAEELTRQEKITIEEHFYKNALQIRVVQGIRNFVLLENELHRSSSVESLSSSYDLAKVFCLPVGAIEKHLNYLFQDDRDYRREQNKGSLPKNTGILPIVQKRIESEEASKLSESYLAAEFSMPQLLVYRLLRQGLSNEMFDRRSTLLGEYGAPQAPFHKPKSFIEEELSLFLSGALDSISSDHEIRRMFNRSDTQSLLREISCHSRGGLSRDAFCKREILLALAQKEQELDRALQDLIRGKVSDALQNVRQRRSRRLHKEQKSSGKDRSVQHLGLTFDSVEEAACASLMQKYLTDFRLEEGVSSQVRVGNRRFDFFYKNIFIEYHPILLFFRRDGRGSFRTLREYRSFLDTFQSLKIKDPKTALEYRAAKRKELFNEYREERQKILGKHESTANSHLIVISNCDELYNRVISEFSNRYIAPDAFRKEWNHLIRSIRKKS
jgi:hypothetical protein